MFYMKITKFTLLLLILFPALLFASPVSKEQARQKAAAFLDARQTKGARKAPAKGATRTLDMVAADKAYYVFNVSDGGFVMMSASDRTEQVLGYADDGTFDPDNAPAPLKAWLSRLSQVVTAVDRGEAVATGRQPNLARRARTFTKNFIPTLVSSRWNQGDPYNRQCPTYNDNGTQKLSATGCVATAMSQLMYFWKWPRTTTPAIPGYTTNWNNTTTTYGELPPTTFDWDAMTDTYDSNSSRESQDAVAELMHYVGKSLNMGYGPSSGASSGQCPRALKTYFGYDKNCYLASASDYSYQDWEDLIYTELQAGRPLLMAGDTSDRTGGHEWVCDGYDGDGCFHMNWGWGGMCDGYFLLTVMFPDQQGIGGSTSSDGYSMGQNIVVGLQPATGPQPDPVETVRISISNIGIDKTEYTRNSANGYFRFSIKYGAGTNLSQAYNFDSAFTLYDSEGNIVKETIGVEKNFEIRPGTWWPSRSCAVTFGPGLADGVYYIRGRSRQNGTTEWHDDDHGDKAYIKAVISGTTKLALTVYPASDLTVNSLDLIGSGGVGTEVKVKANITNNDIVEYYRDTYLLVDDQWVSGNCIVVPGQTTRDYYFKYTPGTAGNHKFALSTSKNASDAFYTTTLTVSEKYVPKLSISMKALSELSGQTVYGNTMRLQVKVRNNGDKPYQSYIEASPWEVSDGLYWKRSSSRQDIDLAPGAETTLEYVFSGLNYGSRYNFHTDSNGGPSANLGDFTFVEGIMYWDADGTLHGAADASGFKLNAGMTAVSFPGRQPKSFSLDGECNPNLFIYFEEGASVSSRIITVLNRNGIHNIVFGSSADNVVLSDDHDMYVPQSLVAASVTYNRAVAADAATAGPWTTIVLPFAPQTVTADGQPVDWFRSADDTGKNLVLREFSAAEGSTLFFSPVDAIAAGRPYIMACAGSVNGTSFDLSGKTLEFAAADAVIESTSRMSTYSTDYKYVGTTTSVVIPGSYVLSADGSAFVRAADGTLSGAFRAYMVANSDAAATVARLPIGDSQTTAIHAVGADGLQKDEPIYNLSGVKVGVYDPAVGLEALPAGVYIVGGKKLVR